MTSEMFDMKEFSKRFTAVLAENSKLQYIKERYQEVASKLIEISRQIESIAESLSPQFQRVNDRKSYGNRAETQDRLNILYEKMVSGVEIDNRIVEKVMEKENTFYYMEKLRAMPNVEERRENNKSFLYIRRGN